MVPREDAKSDAMSFDEFAKLKVADRRALMALAPEEAQAAVEQILHPRLWRVADPEQLAWPGDLADVQKGD
jgi:hypothetical protein